MFSYTICVTLLKDSQTPKSTQIKCLSKARSITHIVPLSKARLLRLFAPY
jgi:hypothetical protein